MLERPQDRIGEMASTIPSRISVLHRRSFQSIAYSQLELG